MAYIYCVPELCPVTKEISCTKPWYCAHIVLVGFLLQEENGICRQGQSLGRFCKNGPQNADEA